MENQVSREADVIRYVADFLNEAQWQVIREPPVAEAQPDLLATSPAGRTYVFEFKLGKGTAHFSWLPLLAWTKEQIQQSSGDRPIAIVLVTTKRVLPSFDQEARNLGFFLLKSRHTEPHAIAADVVQGVLGFEGGEPVGGDLLW
jgi:hypothetical protein